jgi:hypothetical protein
MPKLNEMRWFVGMKLPSGYYERSDQLELWLFGANKQSELRLQKDFKQLEKIMKIEMMENLHVW